MRGKQHEQSLADGAGAIDAEFEQHDLQHRQPRPAVLLLRRLLSPLWFPKEVAEHHPVRGGAHLRACSRDRRKTRCVFGRCMRPLSIRLGFAVTLVDRNFAEKHVGDIKLVCCRRFVVLQLFCVCVQTWFI